MTDPRLARPFWRGRTNVDALTIACIEHAEQIVRQVHPQIAHEFVVTQGSYQDGHGDINSAGTHDLGGVVDLRWCGHVQCILALRLAGMSAAWHRTSAQGPWPDHTHAVVRDHPYQAESAQDQTDDVLAGRNGLSNNGPDDGPRPNPFPHPVWPWPEEEDMAQYEETLKAIKADTGKAVTLLESAKARDAKRWAEMRGRLRTLRTQGTATAADIDQLLALAGEDEEE